MSTVLVVDDSPTQLAGLVRPLRDAGFAVLCAQSADDALDLAERFQPDVIFMDIIMPSMDGYQATRQLMRQASTAHIPVVMITSKNQPSDRVWGLRQGAVAYLTKPVDEPLLVAVAERLSGSYNPILLDAREPLVSPDWDSERTG
ncbi:MAG: response regulator [Pseudomonadota bacterium]